MADGTCFHNLWTGGIERELAPGVRARIFPGVNAMLSVVTIEPRAESPVVMTYRPGRVAEIFDIGLEWPRDLAMTTQPDFQEYVALVRTRIAKSQRSRR
ncbi:MAG: hypothetical protein HY727_02740 [Candidatus Rokubacteria bacterium]|nr:hypothetical protein [Candidatus Rokubacteria bacterium]